MLYYTHFQSYCQANKTFWKNTTALKIFYHTYQFNNNKKEKMFHVEHFSFNVISCSIEHIF